MSRYEIPGPKCNHAISAWICERPACLADADECVRAFSHREPIHIRSTKR